MSLASARPPTGHGFSLLRRHSNALALGTHVGNQLCAGRRLLDVLEDEPVRSAIGETPCLLEDLMFDQRVRELLDDDPDGPGGCPVIVCYEGTPASQAAIETAGSLFPGEGAVILAIWRPSPERTAMRTARHPVMYPRLRQTAGAANARAASAATGIAQMGCEHARRCGLRPQSLTVPASSFEDALVHAAAGWTARAVVVGLGPRARFARIRGARSVDPARLAAAAKAPVVLAAVPSCEGGRPAGAGPELAPRAALVDCPEPAHT